MRNHHRRFDRYYTYDKFTVESSQKLVASSKYMNFNVREKSKHTYCIVSFFILHNIYRSGSVGNLVKKFFQSSECSLLGRKSNPQFLKI